MKVILARSAGFCFGVKRAVNMALEHAGEKRTFTLGPIIHNKEVTDLLCSKGIGIADDISALEEGDTVIIRSHGVAGEVMDMLYSKGVNVVDATCPFVKKIHRYVEEMSSNGREVIIVGDGDHPEVKGIRGWCRSSSYVVSTEDDIEALPIDKNTPVAIVAQTTFNYKRFQELVEIIRRKVYDSVYLGTVCNATKSRQEEATEIASKVDAMIIVGDPESSNSRKLFEECRKHCTRSYFITKLDDLNLTDIEPLQSVGITAGASTPDNLIEEVQRRMSEQSFEQLLEEEPIKSIHNGEVLEGTVIDVKDDQIVLNIGYKADGILSKNEYSNNSDVDLKEEVKPGDTMQVKILKVNDGEGQVLLTYKRLAAERGNKILQEAFENNTVLTGKVERVLTGGLSVTVDEARVFIPASLVSDSFERNLEKYQDQEVEFVITEFNPRKRRIIGDRKQLLTAEKEEKKKALFESIEKGQTIKGSVKNITDFGAFIDLGGADGLLHISEMSWGRVNNPRDILSVGDEVEALIKDIDGEKIALSLKFDDRNPWNDADVKYAVGNVVQGRVARMTDFGAFIELEPGIDALLHVSQISREHVNKPADILNIGDIIEAKVTDFNGEDKKISLSMKVMLPPVDDAAEDEEVSSEEAPAAEAVTEEVAEAAEEPAAEETVTEEVAEEAAEAVEEEAEEPVEGSADTAEEASAE